MGSEAATKSRETKRAATTQELMSNIMTGGEISKEREAELQAAADYGRGIQFVETSGSVKGLTQRDGSPVTKTGAKATDYRGAITASPPTFREIMGDASRALFGGKAKDPEYLRQPISSAPGTTTKNYMQYTPKPTEKKGIVPEIMGKGGLVGMAMSAVLGKEDVKTETPAEKRRRIYEKGVKDYSTLLGGQRNQKGGLIK